MDKRNLRKTIICCALFCILVAGLTVILFPYFQRLSEPAFQGEIKDWVRKMGGWGLLVILGVQVLQVVIAFIPGEPVELLAGVLYGAIGGAFVCLLGCVLASTIIFTLSKRFGKKLLVALFRAENVQKWKWLQDSSKIDMATFLLFFIPGTPKDMLTYVAGVTDMKIEKFIIVSTLARIPSVVSSTMIGSSMRQGKWELSILVFFITGTIGILGIGFKDKIIDFCRKRTSNDNGVVSKGEGLDFVEAAHADRVYPLMYCHMELTGHLNAARLEEAVGLSAQIMPELLCAYDFKRGCFTEQGHTPKNVVSVGKSGSCNMSAWDLSRGPQLQILLCHGDNGDYITVGMSHILSDGEGFKQFLYLLSAFYNGWRPSGPLQNQRSVTLLLKGVRIGRPTEQTRHNNQISAAPIRPFHGGKYSICLHTDIAPDELKAIHTKARIKGVTLNDVFMAAFVQVIAKLQNTNRVVLPCPADLRTFQRIPDHLTVANMTGLYRRVTVEIVPRQSFTSTLAQIRLEMTIQKSRRRCFAGILPLDWAFHKLPLFILRRTIQATYKLSPISYTNIGIIDHKKLAFNDCHISSCYLTGTYRFPPDFQLTVSTFHDVCTLNCSLLGDDTDSNIGQMILGQVKKELLTWIND